MPTYSFRCKSCQNEFDVKLKMGDRTKQPCVSCDSVETTRVFSAMSVVLKGDGWTGKNIKIRGQMRAKNRRIAPKEEAFARDSKEMAAMTISPNVDGEQTDTWVEARELARSKGKDTTTYDSYVRKEKLK
tara:strand:+ start:27 stop:416 length:390 start_codon:yes stop_codon:yes gene_type:complete